MTVRVWTTAVLVLPVLFLSPAFALASDKGTPVSWKKTVIDAKFRSEGVGIGDVNKDGKLDVLVGDSWYEARAGPSTTSGNQGTTAMVCTPTARA